MKTTLEIDDELYREAKVHASLTGRKMKDLVTEIQSLDHGNGVSFAVQPPPDARRSLSLSPEATVPSVFL